MQHFSSRTDGKEWCGQCEQRKTAAGAQLCQSQWCKLKALLPPEATIGFHQPKADPPIGFATAPQPIDPPADVGPALERRPVDVHPSIIARVERERAEAPPPKVAVMDPAPPKPKVERKRDEHGLTPKTRLLLEEMKRRANPDGTVAVSFNDVFETIGCSAPSTVSPLMQQLIERKFVTIVERRGGRAKTRYLVHGLAQEAPLVIQHTAPIEQVAADESCGGCFFSKIMGIGDTRCRRLPPSVVGFPQVSADEWCGEWKAARK